MNEKDQIAILRSALILAFEHSCKRAESKVKWTLRDQVIHETMSAALTACSKCHEKVEAE